MECGDICAVVGIEDFEIGDTIADFEAPEALPPITVDEPTMSMLFTTAHHRGRAYYEYALYHQ